MSRIYDVLPGLEVPPARISAALAGLWEESSAHGKDAPAPEDVKAAQINLVLHFGFAADPADALVQFNKVVSFSARYPGRVVVLCPRFREEEPEADIATRAKVYGECFLGKSKDDTRCCEFVILNYAHSARRFLENQVSVCLDPDLPTYFWAHRFRECRPMADYSWLLTQARRFVVDSAAAPEDVLRYPWPRPANLRDLAYTRTLPLRQSIGQFLSRYAPPLIAQGLVSVACNYEQVHSAEGRALMRWLRGRLVDCGVGESAVIWAEGELPHKAGTCFELRFSYEGGRKRFHWRGDCDTGVAHFSADLGCGRTELPAHIGLLGQEQALAEALFF